MISEKRKSIEKISRAKVLTETYPAIAEYTASWGWIEVGVDGMSGRRGIIARALDEGGLVWETEKPCNNSDQAFRQLEKALQKIMTDNA